MLLSKSHKGPRKTQMNVTHRTPNHCTTELARWGGICHLQRNHEPSSSPNKTKKQPCLVRTPNIMLRTFRPPNPGNEIGTARARDVCVQCGHETHHVCYQGNTGLGTGPVAAGNRFGKHVSESARDGRLEERGIRRRPRDLS